MFTLPQEIEVWYVIPAIRRELAKCLINSHNVTYEKTGRILGISKAAISQYVSSKRAAKIKLHEKALSEVCSSCNLIVEGKSDAVKEITKILNLIREENLSLEVCGKIKDGVLENCREIRIQR